MYKVYAICKLEIPEAINSGLTKVSDIAEKLNLHEEALFRVMRALAAKGIFEQKTKDEFFLNEQSEILLPDHPNTMKFFILFKWAKWYNKAWSNLDYSIKTGKPAFNMAHGKGTFEHFADNPEDRSDFHNAIAKSDLHQIAAKAYDFSVFKTVVDIGGATGTLLLSLLENNPETRGVIFDLPSVEIEAQTNINSYNLSDKCTFHGGDFFKAVPEGDAYILSRILHDWSDEQSIQILKNCRRSISDQGRVFLKEFVITEKNIYSLADMDIEMLVMEGGKERTEEEFSSLFAKSGFDYIDKIDLGGGNHLLEAKPA